MKKTASNELYFYPLAILITIPTFFLWASFNSFTLIKHCSFGILFSAYLIHTVIIHRKIQLQIPRLFLPLLLLVLISSISSAASIQPFYSWLNTFFLSLYILFGVFIYTYTSAETKQLLIKGLLYTTAAVSFLGIIQFFIPGFFTPYSYLPGKWKLISTFGNPSYLAAFLVGVIPLAFQTYLHKKNQENALLFFIPSLCLLLTFARASWVSILAVSIFYLGTGRTIPWKKIIAFLSIIVILTVSIISTQPGFKKHFNNMDSWKGRFFLWQLSTHVMNEHWLFGIGLNQFRMHHLHYQHKLLTQNPNLIKNYAPFSPVEEYVHNDFLQIAIETGIFGIFTMIALLYLLLKQFKKIAAKRKSLEYAAWLGLMGLAINALFFFPFYLPATLLLTIFLLSILAEDSIPLKISLPIKVLISAIALFIMYGSISTIVGDIYLEKGVNLLNQKEYAKSLFSLTKAHQFNSYSGENKYFLAKAYFFNKNYSAAQTHAQEALQSFKNYYVYILSAFIYNISNHKEQYKNIVSFLNTALPGQKLSLKYGLEIE